MIAASIETMLLLFLILLTGIFRVLRSSSTGAFSVLPLLSAYLDGEPRTAGIHIPFGSGRVRV